MASVSCPCCGVVMIPLWLTSTLQCKRSHGGCGFVTGMAVAS